MAIVYNKLVRDKIPMIIESDGKQAITRLLDDKEYLIELIKKLEEETEEFKQDMNVEELADIQEVILALVVAIGASKAQLEQTRSQKATSRGSFSKKIYLKEVV